MSDNIPPELISNIFTRLPVKTLLRCRCLSKFWLSQIDDQRFGKDHLERSLRSGSNLHAILDNRDSLRTVDLDTPAGRVIDFRPPFSAIGFSATANGLVLVGSRGFLWNPFTGRYRAFPVPRVEEHGPGLIPMLEDHALAYDSENNDYIVIKVVEFQLINEGYKWSHSEAMLYSCNSGKWKKTCNFPRALPYHRLCGVHLNGVMHMVAFDGDVWGKLYINGFDVKNEKHFAIPIPLIAVGEEEEVEAKVLDGCLSLVHRRMGNRTDIWMMKEYGVKESWTLLMSVAPRVKVTMSPLALSKDGRVLLNCDDSYLIWFDLKTKIAGNPVVELPNVYGSDVCVASLVRPGSQLRP